MEYSLRLIIILVVALIFAVIIIALLTSWAQGSGNTINSFLDWIKNMFGAKK